MRILDERTLLLPERPGNRIADTLTNIPINPHVGLLFLVPGATETFRVNGRASLTTDPSLLEPCVVEGKIPKLGIVVDVAANPACHALHETTRTRSGPRIFGLKPITSMSE